jgi:hypothetical protein
MQYSTKHFLVCHTGAGRYPYHAEKTTEAAWIPTFVGMTENK